VGEWQVVESAPAEASENPTAGAAATEEADGGRKRTAEGPADEEDERGWKLRKKRLNVGLGEIYDPGIIAVKVKPKEEPEVKAEDEGKGSTQLLTDGANVKTELKWTPVKWRKASEPVESDVRGVDTPDLASHSAPTPASQDEPAPASRVEPTSASDDPQSHVSPAPACHDPPAPKSEGASGGSMFRKRRVPTTGGASSRGRRLG
jgi:WW domain-binding protein 4